MRCITLLLFGLFSATYAAPTPPPVTCMFLTRDYGLRLALAMGAPLFMRILTDYRTSTNQQDDLFYEVADPTFSDQQWTEKLLLEKGFEKDMQQWLEDFLEEMVFKTYLGISARTFPGTYNIFLRKHPRNTKYRIRTPQDFFVTVNLFPRWEPDFEGEVKKTPLSSDLPVTL
ncbi:hypothetical protein F5878DRAFT_647166 [Lentinula raphanica]|uniref:Uncharacterized protein n=1 Tax=Lentinula raphanica TaxID=153919 RepID=A0AA38U4A9_9AGAR|nr:hypothetical protein F5878DRAFT_647166 [Lentinula raphanica]